jgi:hypothetical protein
MRQRDVAWSLRWSPARLVTVTAALLAASCSSKSVVDDDGGRDAAATIFPREFHQSGFQMVRPCRAPGEHSALNGFTVWVNETSAAAYDQLLQGASTGGDGGVRQMPAGSIVVKELYRDPTCDTVDRWVAMKKIAGFDPVNGDWFWQDVSAQGSINLEGRAPSCAGCHEGRADGTCIGYGAVNGMDYLCTAP